MILLVLACANNQVGVKHVAQFEGRTSGFVFVEHDQGVTIAFGSGGGTREAELEVRLTNWLDLILGGTDVVIAGGNDRFAVSCEECGQVAVVQSGADEPSWTSDGDVGPGAVFALDRDLLIGPTATCGVAWIEREQTPREIVVPGCLSGAFTVDPDSARAFFGTQDGIVVVDASGVLRPFSDLQANRLAWSRDGHVYATGLDDRTLVALDDVTGAETSALPADGTITAIATFDEGVAWTTSADSGYGSLVFVDGATRAILSTITMPSAPEALLLSADGGTLAMFLPNEVHLFTVDLR